MININIFEIYIPQWTSADGPHRLQQEGLCLIICRRIPWKVIRDEHIRRFVCTEEEISIKSDCILVCLIIAVIGFFCKWALGDSYDYIGVRMLLDCRRLKEHSPNANFEGLFIFVINNNKYPTSFQFMFTLFHKKGIGNMFTHSNSKQCLHVHVHRFASELPTKWNELFKTQNNKYLLASFCHNTQNVRLSISTDIIYADETGTYLQTRIIYCREIRRQILLNAKFT